jgi:hypothetical protein
MEILGYYELFSTSVRLGTDKRPRVYKDQFPLADSPNFITLMQEPRQLLGDLLKQPWMLDGLVVHTLL